MDFSGKKMLWFIISLVIIIPGIVSIMINGLNFGIDFAGGNLIQVQFQNETSVDTIRTAVNDSGISDALVQESDDNSFIIKTKVITEEQEKTLLASLTNNVGEYEIMRNEGVGPSIGSELRKAGLISLFLALALMVVYITIRFELSFAIAAILALCHDVLITVGIFSILQFEVNSEFIAAVLTVVGYSINATIVIFDRIRENLKAVKKDSLENIVNLSIKQTMARSVNTTITVLFVIISLLIFGGETIRNFNMVLLTGVVSGLYSSVFLAGNFWLVIRNLKGKKA
ncbi:MAG: protein translocase subunit SecF [Eubacteriales bacterium]|nr:protein translocase subunit SecF [Eubacteriales bacterium]